MAKHSQSNDERPVMFYEQLSDIINDVPAEILNADGEEEEAEEGAESEEETEDESTEDAGEEEADSDEDDDSDEDEEDDDDNDDYITKGEDEEEDKPAQNKVAVTPAAPAVTQTELGQYLLENLTKLSVNIIVEGTDGKDVTQRVEVYGYGDLPSNFKGYVSPLEGERFRGAVTAQEVKAQDLRKQFTQDKQNADLKQASEQYTLKENKAIAEDLTDLRKEGIFPKFKGNPGTKEFNESDGAKEFDKTMAFMNKKNDEYMAKANSGKNYRHIGFREAFEMLNGPNPKAAEQAEDKARKRIAGKVVSKRGTRVQTVKAGVARVNNLTDLADEFQAAVSS